MNAHRELAGTVPLGARRRPTRCAAPRPLVEPADTRCVGAIETRYESAQGNRRVARCFSRSASGYVWAILGKMGAERAECAHCGAQRAQNALRNAPGHANAWADAEEKWWGRSPVARSVSVPLWVSYGPSGQVCSERIRRSWCLHSGVCSHHVCD